MQRWILRVTALAWLAPLGACTVAPRQPEGAIVHEQSRWIPAQWADLPGWKDDPVQQAWPALQRSCERPIPQWQAVCAKATKHPPRGEKQVRDWLAQHLVPYRVESLQGSAQ